MRPPIDIQPAADLKVVRTFWNEYWAELGLPADFQGFRQEIASLPGPYAPPHGCLLMALDDAEPVGTIALRRLDALRGEVKRLYVRRSHRRHGVGRALLESIIERARAIGYRALCGDTLPSMTAALTMYEQFGFHRTPPYADCPTPGAIYLELLL